MTTLYLRLTLACRESKVIRLDPACVESVRELRDFEVIDRSARSIVRTTSGAEHTVTEDVYQVMRQIDDLDALKATS